MPASTQDFVAGIDLTGLVTVTAAQLTQLIESGIPSTDKGLALVTADVAGVADVPDAATTTKWQKYIWVRVLASSVAGYFWNPNAASDVTYLKWQSFNLVSIADNSIDGAAKIIDATITAGKILSLTWSQITGRPTLVQSGDTVNPSGTGTTDLQGTYPDNVTIKAAAIINALLGDGSVNNVKILSYNPATAGSGIDITTKLKPGTAKYVARTSDDGLAARWARDYAAELTEVLGTALYGVRMNAAGTALEYAANTFNKTIFSGATVVLSNAGFTNGLTANGVSALAHGLGAIPTYYKLVLLCSTGDLGYTATDEYAGSMGNGAANVPVVVGVVTDATNCTVVYAVGTGAGIKIPRKDTGALTAITPGSWKFKVYAAV